MVIPTLVSCLLSALLVRADPTWVSLNMTVPVRLTDLEYIIPHVPVLVGSPPQTISMPVDLTGDLLGAWSTDCAFCPGKTLFDPELSTSLKNVNKPWTRSSNMAHGTYMGDAFSFGGVINVPQNDFVVMDSMSTDLKPRQFNGHLGVMVSQNVSLRESNIFSRMWDDKLILNPVVGLRLDPLKPKITIGALDPRDYEGEINWVQWEQADLKTWDFFNVVKIDGIKGANGSFVPWGESPLATIDTYNRNIQVPNAMLFLNDSNLTGDIQGNISLFASGSLSGKASVFGYPCTLSPTNDTGSAPYVEMAVTINGVDYMLDSQDNMIRRPSGFYSSTVCNVAITNRSETAAPPPIILGQPFLRSVYLAYRFPTGDCPGYYGFAFPSGLNRTEAQKAQKPRTTPASASQCLNLIKPTTSPVPPPAPSAPGRKLSSSTFKVFKHNEDGQVPLLGWDQLAKGIWNLATRTAI